ncbi:ATPase, T2SS/T4P/T4SS family [Thermosulfurimonas sp. F29]|uniref:ATPase, T2SS/T4P/T4SS family n=1 Tax=Thermosulfurimonas sp. F29 TaxID=2867247 RepID=UPI001C82B5B4|nr:ATPase, T2SS/T4P/T4SS family [Thermosulfurimonas sp. F29]MBX6422395.1 Flp pilus assembly complex ATPase component TadA [Thermosulfurimonas sp. F29]
MLDRELRNYIENRLKEAELYAKQGLVDEALQVYRELRNLVSEEENGLKQEIQKRIFELEAFKGVVSEEITGEESPFEERLKKAFILKDGAFYQQAIKILEELLEEKPALEVYRALAECLEAIGHFEKAASILKKALKEVSFTPEIKNDLLNLKKKLAENLEKAYEFDEALFIYQSLIKEIPEEKEAFREKIEFLKAIVSSCGRLKFLLKKKVVTPSVCKEAAEIARETGESVEQVLIEKFQIPKSEIGEALSRFYNCPFWEFSGEPPETKPRALEGVKESFLRQLVVAPLETDEGKILLVTDNPFNLDKIEQAKKILELRDFEIAVGIREDILKLLDFYYGKFQGIEVPSISELEVVPEEEETSEEEEALPEDQESVVVQLANYILEEAYNRGASDIHIESLTGRRGAQIRFRIDGECIPFQTVPYSMKRPLVSRYKIMAGLDIAEKRLPQDGKIKFRTRTGKVFEVRVATIPTIENNEDVVMRILGGVQARTLEEIGLRPEVLEQFKKLLEMPYGLILVVGPTGSGKTTTLHAALHYINRPSKKIWTAEDPVEIVQEGLRQVQVKPKIGLTFARVLRAFLRADPDVIMIGETRDEETAHTLIEASLTGHLVFSTLHTNSAPETVTRLLGMGIDPYNFADALLGVLAQRLAKRLCPDCKEPYEPTEKDIEELIFEYGKHPLKTLTEEDIRRATLYRPVGCGRCNHTGYRGRVALHELLVPNDEVRELIVKAAPVHEIRDAAMRNGMFTLKQDGILKVLSGETDLKQVRAVCVR